MVITGATKSRLAIKIPISDIAKVNNNALNGSPRFVVTEKKFITGITPSIAIACNNLGAPVQMKIYIIITYLVLSLSFFFQNNQS